MIRLLPFGIWIAGFGWFFFAVTSDYLFADRPLRPWLKGVGLAMVWPLALLSAPGRELLINAWRKL